MTRGGGIFVSIQRGVTMSSVVSVVLVSWAAVVVLGFAVYVLSK